MIDSSLLVVGTFVLSIAALWIGAETFVTTAAGVARHFGLSELIVGLTVVALGTSAPEAAVSIDAALVGNGNIAVANVVGSNLFNIGIVLGGIATVIGVRSSARMVRRDGVAMVLATLLMLVLLWDLRVTRLDGLVLLVAFGGYLAVLFVRPDEPTAPPSDGRAATWRTAVLLVGGLGAIVAVGTSTPEIAASVAAARNGMGDIAAGNLIGSNVFNALFVLGITSTLTPITVVETAISTTVWLLGLSVLTAALLGTKGGIGRLEGIVLVVINLSRWVLDIL